MLIAARRRSEARSARLGRGAGFAATALAFAVVMLGTTLPTPLYAVGLRSSRQVELACRRDVAFKVISAMQVPDNSTIAEFHRWHEAAIGELFSSPMGSEWLSRPTR